MNKVEKALLWIIGIYLIVGVAYGVDYSLTYDPSVASFPNNSTTFMLNVILWPMNNI